MPSRPWDIYRKGDPLDTVWFIDSMTEMEVVESLVTHDGYPDDIYVKLKGPVINGEQFPAGYTEEAAAYEQRTREARVVTRDQYAITCTSAAWPWPDIYGPFDSREAAERFVNTRFAAWVLKGDVVQWKIDTMLNPEEYE